LFFLAVLLFPIFRRQWWLTIASVALYGLLAFVVLRVELDSK
jgi:hypothetical protein